MKSVHRLHLHTLGVCQFLFRSSLDPVNLLDTLLHLFGGCWSLFLGYSSNLVIFAWFPYGFVLSLDHMSHWGFWSFSWFEGLPFFSKTWLCPLSEICFLLFVIVSLKIYLVHFANKRKTNNLFCFILVNEIEAFCCY